MTPLYDVAISGYLEASTRIRSALTVERVVWVGNNSDKRANTGNSGSQRLPYHNSVGTVKTISILPPMLPHQSHLRAKGSLSFVSPTRTDMCAPAMAKSGRAGETCALVAVVQAADLWNGDHTARRQRRDRTWKWCILVQPEVRSRSRVVGDVLVQNAPKAGSR